MKRMITAALSALCVAALAMPVSAHDDVEAENGGLEVEAYPQLADVGELVTVEAEFEAEEADEDDTAEDDTTGDEANGDANGDQANGDQANGDQANGGANADGSASGTAPTAGLAQDEGTPEDDATQQDDAAAPVTFTIDFGDGSGVQPMQLDSDTSSDSSTSCDTGETDQSSDSNTGDEPNSDSSGDPQPPVTNPDNDDSSNDPSGSGGSSDSSTDAGNETCDSDSSTDTTIESEATATHTYAAEGDFVVTVTATPQGGEPVSASLTIHVGGGSARLDGDDREETAVAISREGWDDGDASAVVLSRADAFADALSAAGLAATVDGPVLLTNSAELPAEVIDEIHRLLGGEGVVYLLGGVNAISQAVEDALTALGYEIVRIAGADRIDTSLQIAEQILAAGGDLDEVVLASAANFPDALAGAAHAADDELPVLLTGPEGLDQRVRDFLASLEDGVEDGVEVLVVGGPGAISEQVVADIQALGLEVERLFGESRFDTSAAIAERLFDDATAAVLATGANFPDALAGASHAGLNQAPILLVGDTLPDSVRAYLEDRAGQITELFVLGGPGAVSPEVLAEAEAALGL